MKDRVVLWACALATLALGVLACLGQLPGQ
jgi:hypothetical protein